MGRYDWAPTAYRQLRGLLCVYKPADVSCTQVLARIQQNLARDLNELPCYRVERAMRKTDPEADLRSPMLVDTSLPAPVDHVLEHRLILGQRYLPEDVKVGNIHSLSRFSSGVLVVGVGRGMKKIQDLSMSAFLRVYHVKGRFGMATDDFLPTGKIIERTSWRHVKRVRLDKVLASCQSSHLRNMFTYAGVDSNSQAAYELAARGLVRPQDGKTPPMLYSVKCVHWEPPNFTLEVHSINERCDYLQRLVHDIGLQLKSTAVCSGIRRLRYGPFVTDHALLRQQWTLDDILANLKETTALWHNHNQVSEESFTSIGDQDTQRDRQKKMEG